MPLLKKISFIFSSLKAIPRVLLHGHISLYTLGNYISSLSPGTARIRRYISRSPAISRGNYFHVSYTMPPIFHKHVYLQLLAVPVTFLA